MRYVAYFAIGVCIVLGIIVCGAVFLQSERFMDVLLMPGGLAMSYGPGGKEDPFNLILAVGIQSVFYGLIAAVAHRAWRTFRRPEF